MPIGVELHRLKPILMQYYAFKESILKTKQQKIEF